MCCEYGFIYIYGCVYVYGKNKELCQISVYPKDDNHKISIDSNKITNDTFVCQLHWSTGFKEINVHGKQRPENSAKPKILKSQILIRLRYPRTTQRTLSNILNVTG